MRIYYEYGDKVVHIKRGTIHTVTHVYMGHGLNLRREQQVAVDGSEKYVWARNYRPVSMEIGGKVYLPVNSR